MISHVGKGVVGLLVLTFGCFESIQRRDTAINSQTDFLKF